MMGGGTLGPGGPGFVSGGGTRPAGGALSGQSAMSPVEPYKIGGRTIGCEGSQAVVEQPAWARPQPERARPLTEDSVIALESPIHRSPNAATSPRHTVPDAHLVYDAYLPESAGPIATGLFIEPFAAMPGSLQSALHGVQNDLIRNWRPRETAPGYAQRFPADAAVALRFAERSMDAWWDEIPSHQHFLLRHMPRLLETLFYEGADVVREGHQALLATPDRFMLERYQGLGSIFQAFRRDEWTIVQLAAAMVPAAMIFGGSYYGLGAPGAEAPGFLFEHELVGKIDTTPAWMRAESLPVVMHRDGFRAGEMREVSQGPMHHAKSFEDHHRTYLTAFGLWFRAADARQRLETDTLLLSATGWLSAVQYAVAVDYAMLRLTNRVKMEKYRTPPDIAHYMAEAGVVMGWLNEAALRPNDLHALIEASRFDVPQVQSIIGTINEVVGLERDKGERNRFVPLMPKWQAVTQGAIAALSA